METKEIELSCGTLVIRQRSWSDKSSAPRLYVWGGEDFSVLEDLQNRTRRPYNIFKKILRASDISKHIDISKLSWSQYAGCSCPCSPGFVLNYQGVEGIGYRWDAHLYLEDAPTINAAKPGRLVLA